MQRLKLFFGSILLILILFTFSAASTNVERDETPKVDIQNSLAIQKRAKMYSSRKRALELAINTYFEEAIKSGDIVGAGVSIVKADSILMSDGFGQRNFLEKAKPNGETVFRLGSLSKGFTGVLAAKLVEEGAFKFNDKLSDYLPQFHFGDSLNTSKVKISNILSHTSGTPYHSYTNLVEANVSMEKIAEQFKEVTPISEPGKQYSYQNAMFALSQEVMLKATGKDINTLLMDRFFMPLGMSNISMDHESFSRKENIAKPHAKRGKGWRVLPLKGNYYNAVAAGGIDASPTDMAKWMRFLLGHNPSVMSKRNLDTAFNPFIDLNENNKYYQRWEGHVKSSYAFGWRIHTMKNKITDKEETIWHHGGSVNSYRNEIALFPESDLGICVLMSNNSRLARTVVPDLREIVKQVYELTPEALASL
ncbi:serine hydrolase [Maribacter sp. PR1]|uniref:Serine hydrolase domain-containing protein n=1 Tax=Maribacter cobaltidurans TaxID=1178778 RepID=A0ABU7IWY3_9FLAO|nr:MULTISPECIES: serine hydrolase domain-containing protein [Maribacter]MDC6389622.1 serine hydrolase [Maribacter sp. PR1]MEE1977011.1 serine hydrolase domain-containing protein [Maribacter cobaltidurans]